MVQQKFQKSVGGVGSLDNDILYCLEKAIQHSKKRASKHIQSAKPIKVFKLRVYPIKKVHASLKRDIQVMEERRDSILQTDQHDWMILNEARLREYRGVIMLWQALGLLSENYPTIFTMLKLYIRKRFGSSVNS